MTRRHTVRTESSRKLQSDRSDQFIQGSSDRLLEFVELIQAIGSHGSVSWIGMKKPGGERCVDLVEEFEKQKADAISIGQEPNARGMISKPIPKATAVNATGLPRVPIWLTKAPTPKFAPAAMKRPNEVVKANAVARTAVPYCSGSQRLKIAKLPQKSLRKTAPR